MGVGGQANNPILAVGRVQASLVWPGARPYLPPSGYYEFYRSHQGHSRDDMRSFAKFILLVVLLNLIRYLVGGPVEAMFIIERMHEVIPKYPDVFNNDFDTTDFMISLFYNFMFWLAATWVFHIAHPRVTGNFIAKSFKIFGLMCLFFVSVSAVYMNHYTDAVKPFYLYSMIDALIVFPIVALANGLIYPRLFKKEIGASHAP